MPTTTLLTVPVTSEYNSHRITVIFNGEKMGYSIRDAERLYSCSKIYDSLCTEENTKRFFFISHAFNFLKLLFLYWIYFSIIYLGLLVPWTVYHWSNYKMNCFLFNSINNFKLIFKKKTQTFNLRLIMLFFHLFLFFFLIILFRFDVISIELLKNLGLRI